jgi:hypothetical protein
MKIFWVISYINKISQLISLIYYILSGYMIYFSYNITEWLEEHWQVLQNFQVNIK